MDQKSPIEQALDAHIIDLLRDRLSIRIDTEDNLSSVKVKVRLIVTDTDGSCCEISSDSIVIDHLR